MRVVEGVTGDAMTLAPGESRALDGLYVALGDVAARLDAYAREVAALHPPAVAAAGRARRLGLVEQVLCKRSPPARSGRRRSSPRARSRRSGSPTSCSTTATRRTGARGRRPRRSARRSTTLPKRAGEGGARPAIWLAPFYVSTTDPLVAQHPDWFVHRADGRLRTYDNFGPTYAALDVTHPERARS